MRTLSLAALLLSAQFLSGADPHEIRGVVRDPDGLPIANARVAIQPGGQSQVTAADGTFAFDQLPPGRYKIAIGEDGFESLVRNVDTRTKAAFLEVTLQLAEQSASVTVTDTVEGLSLAPEENRSAVELDRDLLNALPSFGGDTLAVAAELLDPAAASAEGVTLVVDGVETTNLGVTNSAIAEVRVNRAPYSAEYSRPGSARIEVITKSGTQEFHGDINAYLRDHRFDARNAFATERPIQSRRTFEGNLSGPIGASGKNTFILSAEHERDNEQETIYALTPTGLFQQNFASPERETELNLSLRRYHSDRHIFGLRMGFEWEKADGLGVGGTALPETAYASKAREQRLRFDHRWFPRADLFTELRLEFENENEQVRPETDGVPRIVVRDAFTSGSAQQWATQRERGGEVSFALSWQKRRHNIRTGFLVPDMAWRTFEDRENFGGTYTFASLDDYAAGRPLSYTRSAGDPRITVRTRTWALFLQDDWQVRPNLTIGLGLRYDRQNLVSDANNFAPRASLALGLGSNKRTVLRAGAGIFYDRLWSSLYRDSQLLGGERLLSFLLVNPSFPVPAGALGTRTPVNLFRLAQDLRSPYLIHASVSLEHQFSNAVSGAITYNRTRGISLFRTLDANAPFGPDWQRPIAQYALVRRLEPSASSISHALTFQLQVRRGKFFRGTARYRFGRAWDHADGERDLPPNSLDLSREWARADFDRRHQVRVLGAFRLPYDVTLGTIVSYRSGSPYEWTLGRDLNRDGLAAERPAGIGRNALQGPDAFVLDTRLSRTLRMGPDGSQRSLTVSLDAFNVLNQVNFTRVVGNESSPFFGQPVAAGSARRLQLSARFSF